MLAIHWVIARSRRLTDQSRLARTWDAVFCLLFSNVAIAGDSGLEALLQKGVSHGYPGMAMLIEARDGRIRDAAAGYSDLEHRVPLRVEDSFHLASINKTFTAAGTLRLVDQKKLALDATLRTLLGDTVAQIPYADQITVGQLLDHSSGIYATNNDAAYVSTLLGAQADPQRVWSPMDLLALAHKDRQKPQGAPGSGSHYSDTNYILLGMIIERVSGRSYKDYITDVFLEPLGMRSTHFYSDSLGAGAPPSPTKTVQGYLLATDDLRAAIPIHAMFKAVPGEERANGELLNTTLAAERLDAAAGMVTTLRDLAKFASPLFRGRLLSPDSQKLLLSAGDEMDTKPIGTQRIGILQSMRKRYGVLLYKEGDGPGGVNTLMGYLPAKDTVYLGFTNVFGYFDEVEFMMDEVIGPMVEGE